MASLVNLLSILFPILQRYSPPIEKKCEEEPQQTLDLKFGDQLKMKSTTWLNFFLLAVPAHNLFRCARRKLVFHRTIERKLNLTGRCQRVHSFSIVTSWKNYFSCKKKLPAFDGSYLMAVKEGKCISTTITYIFSSEVSTFWVGASIMILYISCPLCSFQTNFLLLKQWQNNVVLFTFTKRLTIDYQNRWQRWLSLKMVVSCFPFKRLPMCVSFART